MRITPQAGSLSRIRLSLALSLAALCAASAVVACSSTTTVQQAPATGDAAATADSSTPDPEDASTPEPAPFKLTSTAYAEGAKIPADQTCTGKDQSPPLAWGPGPEDTKSYAIVFNDDTISFLHSIVYDIPATATELPGALPKTATLSTPAGAKQTDNYKGAPGYAGPCPPTGEHVYELVLYALDAEKLTEIKAATSLEDAEAAIKKHSLKSTKLTGKYEKP